MWRHESKEATCIEYKAADGKQKVIAVKDAKFRANKQFGTYGIVTPELADFLSSGTKGWCIIDSSYVTTSVPIPETYTNEAIFQNWSTALVSDKSAKENCDIWMKYNNHTDSRGVVGVPAVTYTRSQTLDGIPCDLPNQYQNICIFACGDKLDELDPTISSYSSMRLGYSTTYGNRTNNRWSSTVSSSHYVRYVNYGYGDCYYSYKYDNYFVVPVLEL